MSEGLDKGAIVGFCPLLDTGITAPGANLAVLTLNIPSFTAVKTPAILIAAADKLYSIILLADFISPNTFINLPLPYVSPGVTYSLNTIYGDSSIDISIKKSFSSADFSNRIKL